MIHSVLTRVLPDDAAVPPLVHLDREAILPLLEFAFPCRNPCDPFVYDQNPWHLAYCDDFPEEDVP